MKNQFVDIGGYGLHIHCSGITNPPVILEAGLINQEVHGF
jgi:hypothetical protein